MEFLKALLIALIVLTGNLQTEAAFKTEKVLMEALNKVGFHQVVVIPEVATKITFHELDNDGEHISTRASAVDLIAAGEAVRVDFMDFFPTKESKWASRAYMVSEVLICYRRVGEMGGIMTGYRTRGIGAERMNWSHCLMFPHKINDVVRDLEKVQLELNQKAA